MPGEATKFQNVDKLWPWLCHAVALRAAVHAACSMIGLEISALHPNPVLPLAFPYIYIYTDIYIYIYIYIHTYIHTHIHTL